MANFSLPELQAKKFRPRRFELTIKSTIVVGTMCTTMAASTDLALSMDMLSAMAVAL